MLLFNCPANTLTFIVGLILAVFSFRPVENRFPKALSSLSSSSSSSLPSFHSSSSSSSSSLSSSSFLSPSSYASDSILTSSETYEWCRHLTDSNECISSGCCLANYTVAMKTIRGNRHLPASECLPPIREHHFCITKGDPLGIILQLLIAKSSGRSQSMRELSYLQCPCEPGSYCRKDQQDSYISICTKH